MENINLDNSLITGGNGMIGNNINFGIKPSSIEMDITDSNSVDNYVSKLSNISCIIHLAALNLRDSENDYKKSLNVNVNGTTVMLKVAMKYDIPFVLISTGAVFSSENSNIKFDENYTKNPNCVYGLTKALSENITTLYKKTILIRTGWLFGGNQKTHYKFVEHAINNLTLDTEIKASNDFYGSPTYVLDLIDKIKFLIINSKFGINHIVNEGNASGYEIALEISSILNKDNNLINSVSSNNVPNSGPKRSCTEMLDTIYEYNKMRNWKISLKEYVEYYIKKKNNKDINIENIKNNDEKIKLWSNRDKCRLCNSNDINIFFKLEPTPPANHFVDTPKKVDVIPLDICICKNCNHIQLKQIVDPFYQYSNYFYVSSTSNTMTNHLQNSALKFVTDLNLLNDDYILEIGANDGTCVKYLLQNGYKNIIGIDPASNINQRHNLPIVCKFFDSNIIEEFKNNYKPFKLIYAFHCCAHIENIQDVFYSINELLDDNGTFIMEVGYFYEVFKNRLFDVIYHEHIDYHTTTAMNHFSKKNGLTLYKVVENNIQGGSIQFHLSKNKNIIIDNSIILSINKENNINLFNINYLSKWQNIIIRNGKDINYILNSFVSFGKKIAGYGASAKSTTFLYQYKLSNYTIKFIIDDNIYKQNYYTPGLNIPIRSINILDVEKIDYIIILSWNFTDEIIEKLQKYRDNGIRIIIPFPEIKII